MLCGATGLKVRRSQEDVLYLPKRLEPPFLTLDIRSHKFLVRLGQIDDPFNDADNTWNNRQRPAAQNRNQQHDDPRRGIAKDKLVNTKTAEQDGEDSSGQLLVSAHCFPISQRTHVDRLHWLITGTDWWRKLCLAGGAILGHLIIDGAAFCAESGHVVDNSGEIFITGLIRISPAQKSKLGQGSWQLWHSRQESIGVRNYCCCQPNPSPHP